MVTYKDLPERCPLCGGTKQEGKTTFTVDLGFGVVVVTPIRQIGCAAAL